MSKEALIVQGGWDGHTPVESAKLFEEKLTERGYNVTVSDTLDSYTDEALMAKQDLIVPLWTMGTIEKEQEEGLLKTIKAGCGLAGFHGGMCDSFRNNVDYQWMTGGQWVQHPGNIIPEYGVTVIDEEHEITKGIEDFKMLNTEQYWLHVCPSVHVLATTYFDEFDVVMPYAWTKSWGEGRVFFAAWGHTFEDFNIAEALEITLRGMMWASK